MTALNQSGAQTCRKRHSRSGSRFPSLSVRQPYRVRDPDGDGGFGSRRVGPCGGRAAAVRALFWGGTPAGGGVRAGESQPDRGAHGLQPGIRAADGNL